MQITRKNYETFIIDYLDGNLSPQLKKELNAFLSQNPDIKAEFDDMKEMVLIPESISMPGKESLKKTIKSDELNPTAFEYRCIAYLENDLSGNEKNKFEKEISSNPELQKTFKLFQQTKLSPDLSIKYSDKSSLKKPIRSTTRYMMYASMSAAAGLLLLAGFFFLNNPGNVKQNGVLAETTISETSIEIPKTILTEKNIQMADKNTTASKNKTTVKNQKKTNTPTHLKNETPDFVPVELLPQLPEEKPEMALENSPVEEKKDIVLPSEENKPKLANNTLNKKKEPKSKFWDYVAQGINGFSSITGKDVKMSRETDNNGETKMIAFNAGKFGISHSKKE